MNKLKLLMVLMVGILASSCSTTQSTTSTEEQKMRLRERIDSGNYKIEATMAYPRRGRSVPLTSSYSLEIKNDSIFSRLPFYGRAYSVPYGGGDGLIFEAPLNVYNVTYDRKGTAKIEMRAKTSEDEFRYKVEIYPNGSSNIDVTMQQREPMRYTGRLE